MSNESTARPFTACVLTLRGPSSPARLLHGPISPIDWQTAPLTNSAQNQRLTISGQQHIFSVTQGTATVFAHMAIHTHFDPMQQIITGMCVLVACNGAADSAAEAPVAFDAATLPRPGAVPALPAAEAGRLCAALDFVADVLR